MLVALLCLIPTLAGLVAFWLPPGPGVRRLLPAVAAVHLLLSALAWSEPPGGGWLGLDSLGRLFLVITSVVFLAASVYAVSYLREEPAGLQPDMGGEDPFSNAKESVFVGCLLLFLASMTLVCASRHLTLLWVAIEATTLASAPLIYFHRHRRSLEATWKYLLVCSVGIGLALLGNFLLVLAAAGGTSGGAEVLWLDRLAQGPELDPHWLRLAFILLVVGYGTKMGLVPLHTWLPDTHSEAPSVVSALLSGALLNCAFLGILRGLQICAGAGQAPFAQQVMTDFGLVSMAVAALFLLSARDTKRMLAWSSVEHMGILALGIGLGGGGVFFALFHALNHSLCKAAMFLVAGTFLATFRTRLVARLGGAIHTLPVAGTLWVAGFVALSGTPPFAVFLSELGVLRAGLEVHPWLAAAYLVCLATAFVGMARVVLTVALGPPVLAPPVRESWGKSLPPLALLLLALLLGLWVPAWLLEGLRQAAALVGVL